MCQIESDARADRDCVRPFDGRRLTLNDTSIEIDSKASITSASGEAIRTGATLKHHRADEKRLLRPHSMTPFLNGQCDNEKSVFKPVRIFCM